MSSVPRVTSPRHYIWDHISSLSHIAFSQTQYLVTDVHILRGAVISQIFYLGHMSTVSNVNPHPDPVPGVKYLLSPEDTLHPVPEVTVTKYPGLHPQQDSEPGVTRA